MLEAYFFCLYRKMLTGIGIQKFCVKRLPETYNHVDACCLMTSLEQKYIFYILIDFIT